MTTNETATPTQTTILHVGGLQWATSARGIEHTLTVRPGVLGVEANALSQTATVIFDPTRTSLDDLQTWIREWRLPLRRRVPPDAPVRSRRRARHAPPPRGLWRSH